MALKSVLRRRFPDEDPVQLIRAGLVFVNGAPALNPVARVRADAAISVRLSRPLRGTTKIAGALRRADVSGRVALDLGASAGGFTQAFLDAGARRVYAVDIGVGQLRPNIRRDPRVVVLEGTNLARLDRGCGSAGINPRREGSGRGLPPRQPFWEPARGANREPRLRTCDPTASSIANHAMARQRMSGML